MYTVTNYETKKALVAAVKERDVPVYQPGIYDTKAGNTVIEGPHGYHTWYAAVKVIEKDGEFVIPKGSRVK